MVVLTGKFDGKSFVADNLPSDLQPNTPVRIVVASGKRPSAFSQIAANAIKSDLPPDFAAQHHHYMKGVPEAMSATFVDTAFLLALVMKDDELHERAVAWDSALTESCITTEFILLELADALSSPELRAWAVDMIDRIRQDPMIEIVPAHTGLVDSGYQLFCDRPDKGWSLTDCISFSVMAEHGITDALTFDRHFEQAGFRALLRGDPPGD